MRNLLSAGFVRLWRCKTLWLSCAFLAAVTVRSIWTRYSEGVQYGYHSSLDSAFLYDVLFIAFLIPIVCALFIGTDYSDGTIRSKVVCGHNRNGLYLSNLILCSVGSLLMCTASVVPGLCVGLPLLGRFDMETPRVILFFASFYTLSLAWTALFTFLNMLLSSRSITTAVAMLLSLALLMAGTYLEGRLEAQPTVPNYTITISGEIVQTEESPNPAYVHEGPVRDTFQFLSDFNPGGQTIQHLNQNTERLAGLITYDAVLFVIVTGAGLALFQRKDLK